MPQKAIIQESEVIELSKTLSVEKISTQLHTSHRRIQGILEQNKIPIRHHAKRCTSIDLDLLRDLYDQGKTRKEIRAIFHCRGSKVNKALDSIGCTCSPSGVETRIQRYGSISGERHPQWKGGRRKRTGGYILIKDPDNPRAEADGYVLEHIYVWQIQHQKVLPKGWSIHHLNGIKNDNRPENLLALPTKKHLLVIPEIKKKIRELELKVKLLEKALDSQQMIFWSDN